MPRDGAIVFGDLIGEPRPPVLRMECPNSGG